MIKQAIIPVAGFGTRLLPISRALPKELLPIGPKPTLQWIAEEIASVGIDSICLVTSAAKANIDQLFRTDALLEQTLRTQNKTELLNSLWTHGPFAKTKILTATQDQQLGLGHAILCGQDLMQREPFVVALGDCLMGPVGQSQMTKRLTDVFLSHKADAVIAFERVPPEAVSRYGIADPFEQGSVFQLRDLIEKPKPENAPSNLAIAARYVLSYDIFAELQSIEPGQGGEIQLTDALRKMILAGAKVFGVQMNSGETRIDVGNYTGFAQAFIEYALANDKNLRAMAQVILNEQKQ